MTSNVAAHPAEGRREAPLPRIGCNGLLGGRQGPRDVCSPAHTVGIEGRTRSGPTSAIVHPLPQSLENRPLAGGGLTSVFPLRRRDILRSRNMRAKKGRYGGLTPTFGND